MATASQGSVLGPQLFSLYVVSMGKIFRKHGSYLPFCADSSQLYLFVEPDQGQLDDAVHTRERCVRKLLTWLKTQFLILKCNDDETEVFLVGSRHPRYFCPLLPFGKLPLPWYHGSIGVMFDTTMSMETHVTFHLRNIGKVRRHLTLTPDVCECRTCPCELRAGHV